MSVNLMSAIFQAEFFDLKDENGNVTKASTAKLVLLAMADHANDEGEGIYPSIETLCRKTALSPQTIRNTFDALRHNGIIFLNGRSKFGTNNHAINTACFPRAIGKEVVYLTLQPLGGLTGNDDPSNRSLLPPHRLDPNHTLTKIETKEVSLTAEEIEQATRKADAILGLANPADPSKAWTGRDKIRPDLLHYADWYNKVTGQEMTKRVQKSWWKAMGEWKDEGLEVKHLQEAFEARSKWRTVADPNELTKDAAAIKALGDRRVQQIMPEGKSSGYYG